MKVYRLITRNSYEREMFDKASLKLGLDKAVLQDINRKGSTNGVGWLSGGAGQEAVCGGASPSPASCPSAASVKGAGMQGRVSRWGYKPQNLTWAQTTQLSAALGTVTRTLVRCLVTLANICLSLALLPRAEEGKACVAALQSLMRELAGFISRPPSPLQSCRAVLRALCSTEQSRKEEWREEEAG